jgi:hypothetical protein
VHRKQAFPTFLSSLLLLLVDCFLNTANVPFPRPPIDGRKQKGGVQGPPVGVT